MSRILIACPHCQRRLDATGQAPGVILRCPCSAEVEVPLPHRDTAEVVRCSGCGGPRQEGAQRCPFCNADYTLHEQDLEGLCPACCHRVSRSARFCHHCGIPVLNDQTAEVTDHRCPACTTESRLRSRALAGHGPGPADPTQAISVLECPHCAGLWLSREAFQLLERRALAGQLPAQVTVGTPSDTGPRGGPAGAPGGFGAAGRAYRPCVTCGQLMHRTNYGGGSGVVLDTCKEHGAWFDFEELSGVLRWITEGGPERQRRKVMEVSREEDKRRRLRELSSQPQSRSLGGSPFGTSSSGGGWLDSLEILDVLGDIFRAFR